MEIPLESETSLFPFPSFQKRYILTQVENQQLAFPTQWVTEIILVERSQILTMPFYHSMVLGVVHHQGSIIPLITLPRINQGQQTQVVQKNRIQETMKVIHLAESVNKLSGVGLIVEQVIGSISHEQLLANEQKQLENFPSQIEVFQPDRIPPSIWQPR